MKRPAKKNLFLGDTHGDLDFAKSAGKLARAHRAEIIQLGDWGFIFPDAPQLGALSRMLVKLGVTMRFVDGNHDDHPSLKKLQCRTRSRGVTIAKNVIYQPRGSVHEDEEGTRFLFLGGAPSIDRAGRIKGSPGGPKRPSRRPNSSRSFRQEVLSMYLSPTTPLLTHLTLQQRARAGTREPRRSP